MTEDDEAYLKATQLRTEHGYSVFVSWGPSTPCLFDLCCKIGIKTAACAKPPL